MEVTAVLAALADVTAYTAHMCIRQLDWQIRQHPDAVDIWIDRARHFRRLIG